MLSSEVLSVFMKSFVEKLKKVGKLALVPISKPINDAYLRKSSSNLESAKILLASHKLEESVVFAYYAMYNCLLALLFSCGIKSENHAVSIELLGFFDKKLQQSIAFAKKERIDKQYYIDFKLTKKDANDMIIKAEDFTVRCQLLINGLTEEIIQRIQKEVK